MRKKLTSKEEEKKKQKKNQYLLGGLLVFILLASVFGIIASSFGVNSTTQQSTYHGYPVNYAGNFYNVTLPQRILFLSNDPNSLDSLNYTMNLTTQASEYIGSPLYIDALDSYSSQDLYQNLYSQAQRVQLACYKNSTCSDNTLPIKDCSENLIVVKESSQNKIYTYKKCVFIEGNSQDLGKLTDSFLLKLFGAN